MTTRSLSGLTFEVLSPCEYKLVGRELWLNRDDRGWFLVGNDESGSVYFEVPSRDAGAATLAWAMKEAVVQ